MCRKHIVVHKNHDNKQQYQQQRQRHWYTKGPQNQCTWLIHYQHKDQIGIFRNEHQLVSRLLMHMFLTMIYPNVDIRIIDFYLTKHDISYNYYTHCISNCMIIDMDYDG